MTQNAEEGLNDLQYEVARLMGRCIIGLQRYELALKSLLKDADIEIELPRGGDPLRAHRLEGDHETLGLLIRKFLESYLLPEIPGFNEMKVSQSPNHTRMRRYVVTSQEEHQRLKRELAEFLSLRNHLVHYFAADKNLGNVENCERARRELTAAEALIEAQLRYIAELLKDHLHGSTLLIGTLPSVLAMAAGGPIIWESTDIDR